MQEGVLIYLAIAVKIVIVLYNTTMIYCHLHKKITRSIDLKLVIFMNEFIRNYELHI